MGQEFEDVEFEDGLDHQGIEECTNCNGEGSIKVEIKVPCPKCQGFGTRVWINNIFDRPEDKIYDLSEQQRYYIEQKWFGYYRKIIEIAQHELQKIGIQLKIEMTEMPSYRMEYEKQKILMEVQQYVLPKKDL